MGKLVLGLCAVLLFTAPSASASQVTELEKNFFTIGDVSITKETTDKSEDLSWLSAIEDDCGVSEAWSQQKPQSTGITLDQIINMGKKIWEIVKANKPVVEIKTKTANALPKGIQCWDQLESWNFPKAETYKVVYKNLMGIEVVRFTFRVIFTYGGQYQGKGKYITNATIVPADVNVVWGYTFGANVKINQVVNLGTKQNPKAGMEMNLDWMVKTPLVENRKTSTYFLSGEGELIQY
ncbi:MAG: hypothetical protein KDD43_01800 [Bdellovibrionales bacterium]|nr:hypothetical protein [Bdellovibrionales bacterium]